MQNASDFNVQTYQQEAAAFDTATHWSEFLSVFETGAGATGSSTASQSVFTTTARQRSRLTCTRCWATA